MGSLVPAADPPHPSISDRLRPRGLALPISTLGQTHTSPSPSLTGVCENRGTPDPTALARGCPYCHHLLLQLAAVEAEARHHAPVRRARHAGLLEAPAAHRAHGSSCCGERRQAEGARRGPHPAAWWPGRTRGGRPCPCLPACRFGTVWQGARDACLQGAPWLQGRAMLGARTRVVALGREMLSRWSAVTC